MRPLAHEFPQALARWATTDPVLARLGRAHPPVPGFNAHRTAFGSLVRALVHQQISMAAGRSIMSRLTARAGGSLTPARVAALGPAGLRACGISAQKQRYLLDLAGHFAERRLQAARLARLPDQGVIDALTTVQGIGEWTAKMFLIFHLQRPDVMAEGDLGLQIAAARAFGVPRSRAESVLVRRGETWRPYRSLASLVLWQSLRNDPGPVATSR